MLLDNTKNGFTLKSDFELKKAYFLFKIISNKTQILKKVSSNISLDKQEKMLFEKSLDRFDKICLLAHEKNVRVLVDAEESWIQNAIDEIVLSMMMKYNKEKAIIFNTSQMYRHDRLNYLKTLHDKALKNNFFVGIKLDRISLFSGTHNEESIYKIINIMDTKNINRYDPKIWFGQLYGMSDNITFNLASEGFNVIKYLPYGPIKEVIPYLIRRADENTSVKGQTSRELDLIRTELKRRSVI